MGLFSTAFVYCLGVGALTVLDVVFINRVLHLRSARVGVLYLANGVGAFGGSTLMQAAGTRLARHYHHFVRWPVMRWRRIRASMIASWNAWPMCSEPVTFGGGIAIE